MYNLFIYNLIPINHKAFSNMLKFKFIKHYQVFYKFKPNKIIEGNLSIVVSL
jgi:hypothetical protein